jgi:glycosidase
MQSFYKKLIVLKKSNKALWAGEYGGMPVPINNNENVYAWKREKDGNTVIGITNFSASKQQVPINDQSVYGTYTDYFTGQEYLLGEEGFELEPWQYLIFVK